MAFAVILHFDPMTENRVRALWKTLTRKGMNTFMLDMDIRPHISLADFENIDLERACQELGAFARDESPLPVTLDAVGTFPSEEGIVYLAPVVTLELLQLHLRLHNRLGNLGTPRGSYYSPGNWIPHTTVAINLLPEEVSTAIVLCRASDVFKQGKLVEIALVEFPNIRQICGFSLGDA